MKIRPQTPHSKVHSRIIETSVPIGSGGRLQAHTHHVEHLDRDAADRAALMTAYQAEELGQPDEREQPGLPLFWRRVRVGRKR